MVKLTADMAARALIGAAGVFDVDPLQVFVPRKPGAGPSRALAAAGCAVALGGLRRDYARAFQVHPAELSKAEARAGNEFGDLVEMLRWNAKAAQPVTVDGATPDKIAPPPCRRRRRDSANPSPPPSRLRRAAR